MPACTCLSNCLLVLNLSTALSIDWRMATLDQMDRDSSEDEYEENEEEMLDIRCLFCEERATAFERIWGHITEKHEIDFVAKCRAGELDTFRFIQLINYIRKHNTEPAQVDELLASKCFQCDTYLKPTLEDDHLLMFDFDDDDDNNETAPNQGSINNTELNNFKDFENYYKSLSKEKVLEDFFALKVQYDQMRCSINEMGEFIQKTMKDDSDLKEAGVNNLDEKADSQYIESYSHYGIHHVMLSDMPRTLAYKDAILQNANQFKGKSVLDIGCGTGILSLFAAQAGADIVVAVDHSDIIYNTMDIVRQNGYEKVIKTVKGKLESINFEAQNLPAQYDIIISEWMGYFLLFEGMIDTVLFARDHLMKKGGVLLPSRSKMLLAAFSDSDYHSKNIDFWNNVYGFNMSSFIGEVTSESTVDLVKSENICSSVESIAQIDMAQCSLESVQTLCSSFELNFEQGRVVHGLVGWFDCYFDAMDKVVVLSTSPFAERTHWKQTIFPLKDPIFVESGQRLSGQIEIKRNKADARALMVKIVIEKFNLSLEYRV